MDFDKIISDYIVETQTPMTVDEVKGSVQFAQPLINRYGMVGFFGYNVVESALFGEVAIVTLVYVYPEHRRTFKPVALNIFKYLEKEGYEVVELHLSKKINNWIRKHTGSMPKTFIHLGKTVDYIKKLEK